MEEILVEFGEEVAELVSGVTNPSVASDGKRSARKAIDRAQVANAHSNAKTIKLADLIDNLTGLAISDPSFARYYLREKQQQIKVLRGGDPTLYGRAASIIQNELSILND